MSNFAALSQVSTSAPPSPMRPVTARFLRGAAGAMPRTMEPGSVDGVGLAVTVTLFETVAVTLFETVAVTVAAVPVTVAVAVMVEVTVSVTVAVTTVLMLVGALLMMMLIAPLMLMTVLCSMYVLIKTGQITTWVQMTTTTVFGLK